MAAFLLPLASLILLSCTSKKEEARSQLRKSGYSFERSGIFRAAVEGDEEALRNFLRGGMSPEVLSPEDLGDNDSLEGATPLIAGTHAGKDGIVRTLIENGADLGKRTDDGSTALVVAARQGHPKIAKILIEEGADPTVETNSGQSPLLLSAQEGHPSVMATLLNEGADFKTLAPDRQENIMFRSVKRGNVRAVRAALNGGAYPDLRNQAGQTALIWAAIHGQPEAADVLLDRGADVHKRHQGVTPLMFAASQGSPGVASVLLEHGAEFKERERDGATALSLALKNPQTTEVLLENGADPNRVYGNSEVPFLFVAASNGLPETVEVLLQSGADLDATDSETGQSALGEAIEQENAKSATVLIQEGADVGTLSSEERKKALIYTTKAGQHSAVDTLLSSGVDPDTRAESSATPLMYAAQRGDWKTIEVLLQAGAKIKAADRGRASALIYAIANGNADVAKKLIRKGANPNVNTEASNLRRISEEKIERERGRGDTVQISQINASTGLTALEIAAFRGDRSSVDALLSAGADPNGSDSQRGPLTIASLLGHAEIVNSLLSAGANHRGGGITNDESAPVTADLPLKTALVEGQTEVVERLLKAGSDPNVVFTSGEGSLPAIVQAAAYGDRDILAALIEAGADVNATNDEGVTALIEASGDGHMEIVQMLLNHNADPTLKTNEEGVGPIEAANRNNNPEIRAFLRERVEESD